MKKQRTVKETQAELKAARAEHIKYFGARKIRRSIPGIYSRNELESLMHIAWLEGYIRAMRDERGLK